MVRTHVRRIILSLVSGLVVLLSSACTDSHERRQAYFDKGVALFEQGDIARARLELKNVLQIDVRFAPGWYWMGRVEERDGHFRKAFADYSRAIELDPEHVPSMVRRGQILTIAGDVDNAGRDADAALALAPDSTAAIMLRAAVRLRQHDAEGAGADARAVLAIEPGHVQATAMLGVLQYRSGDLDAAIATIEAGISGNPDNLMLKKLLARVFDAAGNVDGTIGVLRELVEAKPDDPRYNRELARYQFEKGRSAAAERGLRDAYARKPNEPVLAIALVQLVAQLHGIDKAKAELAEMRRASPDSTDLLFLQAELERGNGDPAAAESTYRTIIDKAGGEGAVAIRARNAWAKMIAGGKPDQAHTLIAEVLEESPTETAALELRAVMAMDAGDPARAIADLRAVLREFPERALAQWLLGHAHQAKGELALAGEAFEKAISVAPMEPAAYLALAELRVRVGDNDGALRVLERLLEKLPESAVAQEAIAKIHFSNQDWSSMRQTAERIQSLREDHPLGYYLKGLVEQRLGNHAAATELQEQALRRSPDAVEPLIALARSQLALGRPGQAEQRVLEVLERNPNSVVALNLLGDIDAASGAPDKAIGRYREAIRFHPASPVAYRSLARLQLGRDDAAAALDTLRQGVAATEGDGHLLVQLALVYQRLGQTDAAIGAYEELIERYPAAYLPANNLAMLLVQRQDGRRDLDRALEVMQPFKDSDIPQLLDTLGWVHLRRGEAGLAERYLSRAVALGPEIGEIHYHLGSALLELGRLDEARRHLEQAKSVEESFDGKEDAARILSDLAPAG